MEDNKLIIGPFAEQDIKDAKEHYNLKQEGLGNELVNEIENTINKIIKNPMQYPKVKKDMRKQVSIDFRTVFSTFFEKKLLMYFLFFISVGIHLYGKKDLNERLIIKPANIPFGISLAVVKNKRFMTLNLHSCKNFLTSLY